MRRLALVLGVALGACLSRGPPIQPYEDEAGAPDPIDITGDASTPRADVDLGDPFQVIGVTPSHGPWTGKTRATLRGRGFSSSVRVWIGGVEVSPSAVLASDPSRIAVEVPPGKPGPADVRVQSEATAQERTLAAGYVYDAFVVEPSTGATSGGTRVSVTGSGTAWPPATKVSFAGKPCADVVVKDAEHLSCITPANSAGVVDVAVTTGSSASSAREAFTYADSIDGYRGGLSGGALSGRLRVLAFDGFTSTPLAGAKVIAGGNLATATTGVTSAAGIAELASPTLSGAVTVTVAAKCHQPISFVAVPVDTVTVYLNPVLDPACAVGDPPSSGNFSGRSGGVVEGQLVWPGGIEFQRASWRNVPAKARAVERLAAYVFAASGSPLDGFSLPGEGEATTPDSSGDIGYRYTRAYAPGNLTLYALAGVEDRSATPPKFTAYAMGVARGVSVVAGQRTSLVDIPMTTTLAQALTIEPVVPPSGARGPDRLVAQVAVSVAPNLFAILPGGAKTSLLPIAGGVAFVGVPALDGALAGESYSLTASAVTGISRSIPASIVSRIKTTTTNAPVTVGGFLAVPTLRTPSVDVWSGKRVELDAPGSYDLLELVVSSANGLVSWTIVAPPGQTAFDLPDLKALPDDVGLRPGPLTTTVYVARMAPFAYATLRNGQLGPGAWSAYATDVLPGAF